MCQLRILGRKGNCCIMECVDCRNVYLLYKDVSVTITSYALKRMADCVQQIEFGDYCVEMQDGQQRIVVNTPHPHVHFNLSDEDFESLKIALWESACMQEVYELLD